jgi:hypothetical protein
MDAISNSETPASNVEQIEENSIRGVDINDNDTSPTNEDEKNSIMGVDIDDDDTSSAKVDAIQPEDKTTILKTQENTERTNEHKGYETPARLFNNRFVLGEKGKYHRIGETQTVLIDKGEQIKIIDKQIDTFQASIELAKAKNWQAIQLTGSKKFKSEAWFHARAAGLQVIGYEPQAKDLERLELHGQSQNNKASEITNEAIKESLQTAKSNDLSLLQTINNNTGHYVGPVTQETEHHFVQDIGRNTAVIHEKSRFANEDITKIVSQQSAKIQYQAGKGKIETKRDRAQEFSR